MIYDSCLCLWCSAKSLRLADINYYELWHSAYALGAQVCHASPLREIARPPTDVARTCVREQVVFWPSMMSTPDRDAISLSRLFRFNIVANGSPGAIHDNTGHMGAQTSQVHRCSWLWV